MSESLIATSPNATALTIVGAYLFLTLVVGSLLRGSSGTSSQFLHARHTLPTAVTSLAFLAANCGALEIVGMVAASAKYGAMALHFYWIGAIPAMVFVALFIMPIYSQSRALTLPEFLRLRYNEATQVLNAVSMGIMMGFIAGICLYAIACVLHVFLGWSFLQTAGLISPIVFCYILLGGLKATIYNEILQLGVTIAGLAPLAYLSLRKFHGFHGLLASLPPAMSHIWSGLPLAAPKTATMDVVGVIFGLGFILSFGYWCTDFVLIQRALAAKDMRGSINTPLIAGAFKLVFPLFVVAPGLAASTFFASQKGGSFDYTLPFLMRRYYGPGVLGIGIAGILASLMSGLAGNINGISTLWTHDLYKTYLKPHKRDEHYVLVGRLATVVASVFSVMTAYIAFRYNSLMDYLQLLFSLFNAPLFATLLLGVFTTWATPKAGFFGLICGMLAAIAHNFAFRFHLLQYRSEMTANFYGAMYGWSVCMIATMVISLFTQGKPISELVGVTYPTRISATGRIPASSLAFASILIGLCALLNYIFR
jgi:SSS family solute:Na+ symporter